MLEQQQQATDEDERFEILQELQQRLYDDIVAIWLYYRLDIVAVNDRVQGLDPTPFGGSFWNTGDWSISD